MHCIRLVSYKSVTSIANNVRIKLSFEIESTSCWRINNICISDICDYLFFEMWFYLLVFFTVYMIFLWHWSNTTNIGTTVNTDGSGSLTPGHQYPQYWEHSHAFSTVQGLIAFSGCVACKPRKMHSNHWRTKTQGCIFAVKEGWALMGSYNANNLGPISI